MFRKLVSNLAFSPALVGQLGFYAKRLKKEEATRRIGLIFTALALVVQSFAVFQPPESANASNPSNFIQGGVTSKDAYIRAYDANTNNIRDLFNAVGISRQNLVDMQDAPHYSKGKFSWGLTSRFSAAQGERTYDVRTETGGLRTFFYRPLELWDNGRETRYEGWVGHTSSGMWFAISKACGNLVLKQLPPVPPCPAGMTGTYPNCTVPPKMCEVPGKGHLPAGDPGCRPEPKCPVPGKEGLNANDPNCRPDPVTTCDALRITKVLSTYRFSAQASAANGGRITGYTYIVKKDGKVVTTKDISSDKPTNEFDYTQTKEGNYTVELVVKTSLGDRTGPNCVKTFNVTPPPVCPVNPKLPASSPECQPCPGDTTLWIKDAKCQAEVIQTKTAQNTTQNIDATKAIARASDRIVYTLNVENRGKAPATVAIKEQLDDVMEYATIIDNGGGTLTDKVMTWPSFTLKPGEKQSRMFTVQVLSTIPSMGQGTSDRTSYDCKMINTFGNAVTINVDCPPQKQIVEQTVAQLPKTGPTENMIFAGITLAVVAFFYARARQMKQEVRLIRRSYSAGTI